MNCPICDSKMEYKCYVEDGGHISEEYSWCRNGCCSNNFAYGKTKITIFGEKTFRFNYDYTEEQKAYVQKDLDEEIAYWINDFKYLAKLMEEPEMHTIDRALGFKVYERIGPTYINEDAIAKFKVKGDD